MRDRDRGRDIGIGRNRLHAGSLIQDPIPGPRDPLVFFLIHERHRERERERGRDTGRGRNRLHAGSLMQDSIPGSPDHALS